MKTRIRLLLGTVLVLAFTGIGHAQGNVNVSPEGNDTETCGTEVAPCKTINYGISRASSGGAINVHPGEYNEAVVVNKTLAIWAQPGAIIKVAERGVGITIAADNVIINGFTIRGPHTTPFWDYNWPGDMQTYGISATNRSNITIEDNDIADVRSGIQLLGTSTGQMLNNKIDNTKGAILAWNGTDTILASENTEGEVGNEWGIVLVGKAFNPNTPDAPVQESGLLPLQTTEGQPDPAAFRAYGAAVMKLSTENNGMTVLDRRYGSSNRSHAFVTVDATPGPDDDFGLGNGLGNPRQPYGAIQHAVTAVVSGGIVSVGAGTYSEDIVVDKALSLIGPNAAISPNTGTRTAEAILRPATATEGTGGSIIHISAENTSGVIVDGFTIDGNNPDLEAIPNGFNGASQHTAQGVSLTGYNVNGVQITNNTFRNLSYFGVFLYGSSDPASSNKPTKGHVVSDNLFEDLGTYNSANNDLNRWGGGIIIYNSHYTNIENNVMNNVRIGIQTGNFQRAHPAVESGEALSNRIAGNTISTRSRGIFYNLHRHTPFVIEDNEITAVGSEHESNWKGILFGSQSNNSSDAEIIFSGNTIDGDALDAATRSSGIEVWNVHRNAMVNISGGDVKNVRIGVFLNNLGGYGTSNGEAGAGAHASLENTTIQADSIGVFVHDHPESASERPVGLQIGAGVQISAGEVGLLLVGDQAAILNENGNLSGLSFSGNETELIRLEDGFAQNLDATAVLFNGQTVSQVDASEQSFRSVGARITHYIDDVALGFVRLNSAMVHVNAGGSIERAIEKISGGTVYLGEGEFAGTTSVTKPVTIKGTGAQTIIRGDYFASLDTDASTMNEWAETATSAPDQPNKDGFQIKNSFTTIRDLKIVDFFSGIHFNHNEKVQNTQIIDVTMENLYHGIRKATQSEIERLHLEDGAIRNSVNGITFHKHMSAAGMATEVTIDGTAFSDLSYKGIYVETFNRSDIKNVTFDNVGYFGNLGNGANGSAISLNLKAGNYSGISIDDFTMNDVGLSSGSGTTSHSGGAAITVKTRDDSPSYNTTPATYTGVLPIRNGTITGTSTGIRVGEVGKTNAGPAVRVENVTISEVAETPHAAVDNVSKAAFAWVLSANEASPASTSTGPFRFIPGSQTTSITGAAGSDIAVIPGTLAAHTISGGGDDPFVVSGPSGTITLNNIEFVQFSDQLKLLEVVDVANATEEQVTEQLTNIVSTVTANMDAESEEEPAPVVITLPETTDPAETSANLLKMVSAVANIPPPPPPTDPEAPAPPPVVIQVDIPVKADQAPPMELEAMSFSIPAGIKLVVNLGGNKVVVSGAGKVAAARSSYRTFDAGSPAILANSDGILELANGIIEQSGSDHPAIHVVKGGVLLNNVTVIESAAFANAAIYVESAGTLAIAPGSANVLEVQGSGLFIDYAAAGNVNITSLTLRLDGQTLTDPFEIELRMNHKVDEGTRGFLTWVADNAYVPNADIADNTKINNAFAAVSANGAVHLQGGTGDDTLTMSSRDRSIYFVSGGGSDTFTGGTKTDVVVVSGAASDYSIADNGSESFIVTDTRVPARTLTLTAIEFLSFESGGMLNLTGTGPVDPPAGQAMPKTFTIHPVIANPAQTVQLRAELDTPGNWVSFVVNKNGAELLLASVQDGGTGDLNTSASAVTALLNVSQLNEEALNTLRMYETTAKVNDIAGLSAFNAMLTLSANIEVVAVPSVYGKVSPSGGSTPGVTDVSFILQFSVQSRVPTSQQFNAADVNKDGFVNANDASHVMEKIGNPEYCFPVETDCGVSKMAPFAGLLEWRERSDAEGNWLELVLSNSSGIRSVDIEWPEFGGNGIQLMNPDGWMQASATVDGTFRWAAAGATDMKDGALIRISTSSASLFNTSEMNILLNGEWAEVRGGVTTSLSETGSDQPDDFRLDQNFPNPFNPSTDIQFHLTEAAAVKLEVYNILGIKVATLVDAQRHAGTHTVRFDASRLSSGTYIYRITAGKYVESRKMMLLK